MVTLNIIPAHDPPYSVDDNGAVHIILKDIANSYLDYRPMHLSREWLILLAA